MRILFSKQSWFFLTKSQLNIYIYIYIHIHQTYFFMIYLPMKLPLDISTSDTNKFFLHHPWVSNPGLQAILRLTIGQDRTWNLSYTRGCLCAIWEGIARVSSLERKRGRGRRRSSLLFYLFP